jgi:hypothetical protein
MSVFQSTKIWMVDQFDLARDALHIYVGLGVFFAVALLFRLSLRDWRPLAAVFLAAVAGEVWDILDDRRQGDVVDLAANWHDIANTCFWPLAIFLLARFTPLIRR